MATERTEPHVVEPEVLPPEGSRPRRRGLQRFLEAFGPIGAGMLIDLVDFALRGPIGFMFGMLVAGTLAYVLSGFYGQRPWQRFLWALAAGIYCVLPRLDMLPLATILTAAISYWKSEKKE